MKYIYYIFGIVVLLTCAVWGSALFRSHPQPSTADLGVNELVMSAQELQQRWQQRPYHQETSQSFLEELISQQLLVDQAIKQGVASEPAFKRSVQTFFEQSLVRTLLERKIASLETTVSSDEIAAWQQAWAQSYQLSLIRTGSAAASEQVVSQQLQQHFSELPDVFKLLLLNLQPGELSEPVSDGDGWLQLRIDRIEAAQPAAITQFSDADVEQRLRMVKQQQELDRWMVSLKEQAEISYPENFMTREEK